MADYADIIAAAPSFRRAKDPKPWASFDDRTGMGEGEVSYWCNQDELADALVAIEGTTEVIDLGGGFTLTRRVPLLHHLYPALYKVFVRFEEYVAYGGNGPQAKIQVRFASRGEGTDGTAIDVTGSQVEEPVDGARFDVTNGTPSFEPSRTTPIVTYSISVDDAPGMTEAHLAFLTEKAGSTNDATWRNHPAGTARFHSPRVRFYRKANGDPTASYSLQIDARELNWNYERDRAGVPRLLLVNGAPRYGAIDFNDLFV